MSRHSDIKKLLSSSTTMPFGTGGGASFLTGATARPAHTHSHEHNADGSCCGGHHDHDDEHKHKG